MQSNEAPYNKDEPLYNDDETDKTRVRKYLESIGFRGVNALKLLNVLGDRASARYFEQEGSVLATVRYAVPDFSYDRVHYADAQQVLIAAGNDGGALLEALNDLPHGPNIVKGVSELLELQLVKAGNFEIAQKILTFSAVKQPRLREPPADIVEHGPDAGEPRPRGSGDGSNPDTPMIVSQSSTIRDDFLPLFGLLDYDRAALEQLLEHDGTIHYIEIGGKPVCACVAFHNHGPLYEIGALATLPDYRGRGLARTVVASAVGDRLAAGKTVRYNVVSTNLGSIKVAESVGLEKVLEYCHYRVNIAPLIPTIANSSISRHAK